MSTWDPPKTSDLQRAHGAVREAARQLVQRTQHALLTQRRVLQATADPSAPVLPVLAAVEAEIGPQSPALAEVRDALDAQAQQLVKARLPSMAALDAELLTCDMDRARGVLAAEHLCVEARTRLALAGLLNQPQGLGSLARTPRQQLVGRASRKRVRASIGDGDSDGDGDEDARARKRRPAPLSLDALGATATRGCARTQVVAVLDAQAPGLAAVLELCCGTLLRARLFLDARNCVRAMAVWGFDDGPAPAAAPAARAPARAPSLATSLVRSVQALADYYVQLTHDDADDADTDAAAGARIRGNAARFAAWFDSYASALSDPCTVCRRLLCGPGIGVAPPTWRSLDAPHLAMHEYCAKVSRYAELLP